MLYDEPQIVGSDWHMEHAGITSKNQGRLNPHPVPSASALVPHQKLHLRLVVVQASTPYIAPGLNKSDATPFNSFSRKSIAKPPRNFIVLGVHVYCVRA